MFNKVVSMESILPFHADKKATVVLAWYSWWMVIRCTSNSGPVHVMVQCELTSPVQIVFCWYVCLLLTMPLLILLDSMLQKQVTISEIATPFREEVTVRQHEICHNARHCSLVQIMYCFHISLLSAMLLSILTEFSQIFHLLLGCHNVQIRTCADKKVATVWLEVGDESHHNMCCHFPIKLGSLTWSLSS